MLGGRLYTVRIQPDAGFIDMQAIQTIYSQLYENYKRQNTDGVSVPFLILWIFGDLFNLLGVILENLLVTMVTIGCLCMHAVEIFFFLLNLFLPGNLFSS